MMVHIFILPQVKQRVSVAASPVCLHSKTLSHKQNQNKTKKNNAEEEEKTGEMKSIFEGETKVNRKLPRQETVKALQLSLQRSTGEQQFIHLQSCVKTGRHIRWILSEPKK